ncbi:MAG: hypothetical protein Q7U91_14385 [Sideroxyarcus sp.]|nr:hypothetical protein [Sideroxyarcus sp.]
MKATLNEIHNYIGSQRFVFVGCASFEDRCLSIPRSIDIGNIEKALIFRAKEFLFYSERNSNHLASIFKDKFVEVPFSISNPFTVADRISSFLCSGTLCLDSYNVIFDISTFTRESMLIILRYLLINRSALGRVVLLYNSTANMPDHLSLGPLALRSVLGYSGIMYPTRPLHLILILGFEIERAREIITRLEPQMLSIAYGKQSGSINSELHDRNSRFLDQMQCAYGSTMTAFPISVVDPFETSTDLAEYSLKFNEFNTVISPLNTKLSAIGAGLYCIDNPEAQICYLQMGEYNFSEYSTPSDSFYGYDMP